MGVGNGLLCGLTTLMNLRRFVDFSLVRTQWKLPGSLCGGPEIKSLLSNFEIIGLLFPYFIDDLE